jgi:hypothetical protein
MDVKRKGIALLWVVLTSTLILVGIVGMSMKVVPQKKIENSRQYTQRALAVAESGLADTSYKLRTGTPAPSTSGPVPVIIKDVLLGGGPYDSGDVPYDSGAAATGSSDATYQVVIREMATGTGYTFYSLGTLYSQTSTTVPSGTPLARQAISVSYSGHFMIGEYAFLTEGSINVHNGTVDGDIFANTSVEVRTANNAATLTGTAYCPANSFTGVPVAEQGSSVRPIDIPTIGLDSYRQEWTAFVNGTGHYATGTYLDTTSQYPNTSILEVKQFIQSYILTRSGAAPQSQFDNFFSAVTTGSDEVATYLRWYLNRGDLTFDISPAGNGNTGAVKLGSLYSSTDDSRVLQGTIVIEGNLELNGNAVVGVDPSFKTALLVTGGVNIVGSGSQQSVVNGLLYIEGTWGQISHIPLSFDGGGGFQCNGSIVASDPMGQIYLASSNVVVNYEPNSIYASEIQTSVEEQLSRLSPVPSSWQQISYDAFTTAAASP